VKFGPVSSAGATKQRKKKVVGGGERGCFTTWEGGGQMEIGKTPKRHISAKSHGLEESPDELTQKS